MYLVKEEQLPQEDHQQVDPEDLEDLVVEVDLVQEQEPELELVPEQVLEPELELELVLEPELVLVLELEQVLELVVELVVEAPSEVVDHLLVQLPQN